MKKIRIILKVILVLMGLTLVYSGFMWGFAPSGNLTTYVIDIRTIAGMNMIKSDIGGPLMLAGIFIVLYAIKEDHWFYPALMIGLSYLIPRVVSAVVDGIEPVIITGIAMEILVPLLVVGLRAVSRRIKDIS